MTFNKKFHAIALTKYPEPKRVKIGRTKTVLDMDGKTPLNGLA